MPVSWAVLLHDIGKPAARRVDEEGRVLFWHHDEIGRGMAAAIAARLRMSNRFTAYLGTLIRQHLRLGFLVREQPLTRRALARYRRDVSPWVFESVVVSLCDRLATRGEKTSLASMARHYRVARSVWTAVSKAPVPQMLSGDEVMELLGLEPGTAVGQALDALEEEVEAGEIATAEEARAFLVIGGGSERTRRWTAARPPGRRLMPELPEVETVRRRLLTCLPGLVVRDVVVNDAHGERAERGGASRAARRPSRRRPAASRQVPDRRSGRGGGLAGRAGPGAGPTTPSSTCA